jgi:ribonuclease VapC
LIVDTSALIAVACCENGWEQLLDAMATSPVVIPAPVLTELWLVLNGRHSGFLSIGEDLISSITAAGAEIAPFEQRHAEITSAARQRFGKGNGKGGTLNFGDLLVYAVAKDRGEALLCTGQDFASTDLEIHPGSRVS